MSAAIQQAPEDLTASRPATQRSGEVNRVLVVDDDRDHAESIADILEMHGYSVDLAFTGEDGVRRFTEKGFDVTVMDVKLPGINGVEAFFEISRIKPDAQVIMMTGFSLEHLLAQAVLSGAAGILHKPFAVADLLRALDQLRSGPPRAKTA